MARITMRKVQETKLSEVFSLYLASAAAKGVKDKTLRTYEQHFNAISKRLNVDSNISLTTSTAKGKALETLILAIFNQIAYVVGTNDVKTETNQFDCIYN